jgi:hypothetical protein
MKRRSFIFEAKHVKFLLLSLGVIFMIVALYATLKVFMYMSKI